jgi:hypothetical protein
MAKLTLSEITAGHGSTALINANFDAIEAIVELLVSRDGTSPNTMTADFDMNGNSILNAGNFNSDFNVRGDWTTATAYAVGDVVHVPITDPGSNGGGSFYAQTAHTSGTFDTDLASGYWLQLTARGAAGAAGGIQASNNLSDLDNLTTALNNLITAHGALATADIADNAITLAKITSGTDGELITWDASGDPATVAVGTAGHVLTSNGTGAAPTFQAGGTAASQSEMETGTSTAVFSTPGRQHFHAGHPKAWARFDGTTGALDASYNIATASRTAAGTYSITFTNPMSSANYCVVATASGSATTTDIVCSVGRSGGAGAPTTAGFDLDCGITSTGAAHDPDEVYFMVLGDL